MNKKVVNLLKMFVLSVSLILIFRLVSENIEDKRDDINNDEHIDYIIGEDGYTGYYFAMGTSISVSVYNEDAEFISDKISDSIKKLDQEELSWRTTDSELYKLNNSYKPGTEHEISEILYTAISESYNICSDSQGALDITIRPLADVWNIESADSESFVVPSEKDIEDSLVDIGYENLILSNSEDKRSIRIDNKNMSIDLGAVGKGYALDVVKPILVDNNVDGAVISIGGSVMVYGDRPDDSDWRVGIRNPKGGVDDLIGYLLFPSGSIMCISTSGDYEKYFIVDSVRYHHILDCSTGYPSYSGLASVTVVCENGLVSDGLSTACFVLGYEKSLTLLKEYNAEAVFVDAENNVIVTDGLKDMYFELQ